MGTAKSEGLFETKRKGKIMENSKMTQVVALTNAIEAMRNAGGRDEVIKVLEHMLAQKTKPRTASKTPSKTTLKNQAIGAKVRECLIDKPAMSTAEILNYVVTQGISDEVRSTQKMNAILERFVPGARKEKTKNGVLYSVDANSTATLK